MSFLKKIFKKLAEDEEIKKKFDNFPDFSGHIDLKKSIFFTHLFKTTQAKNIIKSDLEIIIAALQDFVLLKHFFEPDWITQIPDSIIKECYKALKENATEEKKEKNNLSLIGKELRILSRYFKIKNINENKYLTLEDHLKIYSQKEDIFLTVNSCIHFISILKATKTECFEELIKIRGEMKKNIILEDIKTFGESLKKYGLKIIDSTNEDRDYLDILLFLNEKENALKFLAEHKSEDFRTLREQMIESEQTLLTNNDIQDTIKCNEFIQNLIKEGQTDKELIENFVNLVPKKKGITAAFKNYSSNSNQIIDLFDEKFDKKKAAIKKIKNIMLSSKFTLSMTNKKGNFLEFTGIFIDSEDNSEKKIDLDEIKELRGRAMLSKKLGEEKSIEEKEISQYNKSLRILFHRKIYLYY